MQIKNDKFIKMQKNAQKNMKKNKQKSQLFMKMMQKNHVFDSLDNIE